MIDTQVLAEEPPSRGLPMAEPFDGLLEAHIAMLTGSFLHGVEPGPDGARYVWSETIPDPTFNFACGLRSANQVEWALGVARGRGREPAFLARDAQEAAVLGALIEAEAVFPASWMVAETAAVSPHPDDADAIIRLAEPEPPERFHHVFGRLSDDDRIRDHVQNYYVGSLRKARGQPDVEPLHLVLEDETGPTACASLYLRNGLAGLYNVGTRADRQRRGLGARMTAYALAEARERGASHVFLQCPADDFVERLYRRAGFQLACSPSLVCLTAP